MKTPDHLVLTEILANFSTFMMKGNIWSSAEFLVTQTCLASYCNLGSNFHTCVVSSWRDMCALMLGNDL
jgi:hypothetical protein